MSAEERLDSLAQQAAAWVPPWDRPQRPAMSSPGSPAVDPVDEDDAPDRDAPDRDAPDRDAPDRDAPDCDAPDYDALDYDTHGTVRGDGVARDISPHAASSAADGSDGDGSDGDGSDDVSEGGCDDVDEEPAEVPPELPPVPGEAQTAPTVDAPQPGGAAPLEPDIPAPDATPDSVPDETDDGGVPIDAPVPLDGEDAGAVFDTAAGDDTTDDSEDDVPGVPATAVGDPDAASMDLESPADPAESETVPPIDAAEPEPGGDAKGDAESEFVARAPVAVPVQGRGRRHAESLGVAAETRTAELPALDDDAELRAALEAILLVVDQPIAELQLAQLVEQPTERVAAVLDRVSQEYTTAGRGFDLRRAAGGWRLYTRPEYAGYVERYVLDGQSARLTQAALETLAVVAYKQPVTRSRISAIRGVNCDGVMRTLVTRGLVEEVGTEPESGAYLYRTTTVFLEKLGLNSVNQLPPLAPFLPDDLEEEFDAQR